MNAATIETTGPPEVIRFGEVPDPDPGPGEVLVEVGAVAVNPIDTYIRSGAIPSSIGRLWTCSACGRGSVSV